MTTASGDRKGAGASASAGCPYFASPRRVPPRCPRAACCRARMTALALTDRDTVAAGPLPGHLAEASAARLECCADAVQHGEREQTVVVEVHGVRPAGAGGRRRLLRERVRGRGVRRTGAQYGPQAAGVRE